MPKINDLTNQLTGIYRLPGIAWTVWLVYENANWGVKDSQGLTHNQRTQLIESLKSPALQAWIKDVQVSGCPGWQVMPDFSGGAQRLRAYALAKSTGNRVLLVGIKENFDSREILSNIQREISSLMDLPGANSELPGMQRSMSGNLPVEDSHTEGAGRNSIENCVQQMEEWIAQTAGAAQVLLVFEKDGRTSCIGRSGELPEQKLDGMKAVSLPLDGIAPWKGCWLVAFLEPGVQPSHDWWDAARKQAERFQPKVMEGLLRRALDGETETRQMLENQLEHATRLISLGELAAGVSHEMVSPLATISGFLRMALDEIDPQSPVYDDLTLALHESERLRDLVGRMLDLARVPDRVLRKVDVNDLTRDVVALTFPSMRMAGVSIETELQSDLPPIQGEPSSLKQVMINLIQNAIQAMPDGGKIHIRTGDGERCDRKGVVWQIVDHGPGIQPEFIPKIFEPFFTTKPKGAGTGLGLAIVKSIVQNYGGEIEVATTMNQGTAFTVWLPIKDAGGQFD